MPWQVHIMTPEEEEEERRKIAENWKLAVNVAAIMIGLTIAAIVGIWILSLFGII